MIKNKKAQMLLEFAFLLAIVMAALFIIGQYLRNAFSGKYRESAERFGQGEVYRPFGNTTVTTSGDTR